MKMKHEQSKIEQSNASRHDREETSPPGKTSETIEEQSGSSPMHEKESASKHISRSDDLESGDQERSSKSWSSNETAAESVLSSENCDSPYSYSNPHDVRVVAIHADWTISDVTPVIVGRVVLDIEQVNPAVTDLVLDFAELLIITVQEATTREPLLYTENTRCVDCSISIDLAECFSRSSKCSVNIMYQKISMAGLSCNEYYDKNIEDRDNKTKPLMHSEFDYFRGRNLFPCQDLPNNQITFGASIHIDKELQMLMSAKLVKTVQQNSRTNILYFVNPYPIPVYAIGFVVGKFYTHKISENVTIHTEGKIPRKYLKHLEQIPRYLKMLDDLVGEDPWGAHHIVLASNTTVSTYPYLYIFPKTMPSPDVILESLSYNWFRAAITVRHIDDMWLNEAFPAYIAKRLSALTGDAESEKRIGTAVSNAKWFDTLHFNPKQFSDSNTLSMIIDKSFLCLLVLEYYGGRYGEFESFLRDYYEESKYNYVGMNTFVRLAKKHLVFRYTEETGDTSLSPLLHEVSDIANWINKGARTPEEFLNKITPEYDENETVAWLLEDPHDSEAKQRKRVEPENEEQECQSPLKYLTPDFVNHRERKLVLLRKLKKYATQPFSAENKIEILKTRLFQVLEDRLALNCDEDFRMKYEFIMLSIAHQIDAELRHIKHFVSKSADMEHLMNIMKGMLLWQKSINRIMRLEDHDQTPMRREIIQICDRRLEQLISGEEERVRNVKMVDS